MQIDSFFHEGTCTWCHVLSADGEAAVVDAVLDYDFRSGNTGTGFADMVLAHVQKNNWRLRYVWETHVHADHVSAASFLKQHTGARIGIGAGIRQVQTHFQNVLHLPALADDFDDLWLDGDCAPLGDEMVGIMAAPGHTPDSLCFVTSAGVLTGDTLFAPDVGSARCDFPGGSAHALYQSAQKILALAPQTRLYLGHDYPPVKTDGSMRAPLAFTSVAEQRAHNIHINSATNAEDFFALRDARDAGLAAPQLLWPALNCNIRGGRLPEPDSNGVRYLKVPLNKFKR